MLSEDTPTFPLPQYRLQLFSVLFWVTNMAVTQQMDMFLSVVEI